MQAQAIPFSGNESKSLLAVGMQAPAFALPDQDGNIINLADYQGKNVVLFFYPKDESAGCTAEACSFRDSHEVFKQAGAEVIGVSQDSVKSHDRFAKKNRLPYKLLSDEGGKVWRSFGVPITFGIIRGRVTFVIDRTGIIRHVFQSQLNTSAHVQEALAVLKTLG